MMKLMRKKSVIGNPSAFVSTCVLNFLSSEGRGAPTSRARASQSHIVCVFVYKFFFQIHHTQSVAVARSQQYSSVAVAAL